jgi:NADH-quinone oxidoreductase subunit G
VNKYWMCDDGMLDYQRIHSGRVLQARIRGEATTFGVALEKAAGWLKAAATDKLAVVLSAQHSNEDNFALLSLARDHFGVRQFFLSGKAPGPADDILRHPDKNPNTRGVTQLLGTAPPRPFSEFVKALNEGQFTHVLALGSYLTAPEHAAALKSAKVIIALATHEGPLVERAEVVLPVSSWAECDGTFVNAKGLAQESEKVIRPQGDSLPGWKVVAALARELGHPLGWKKLAELRAAMPPARGSVRPGPSINTGAGAAE